ncbi:hypothetical protein [Roseovarius sp. 2305UL8-3]|uniref:hypothetical protein n=1 Tax=Roseovarius conchicola TaxID=3121636 RepID=UPI003529AE2B
MSFDFTTEAIAHFIGSFNQIIEEARLRTDYDPFEGEADNYDEANGLPNIVVKVAAPLNTAGYDAGISYSVQLLPLPDRFEPVSVFLNAGFGQATPFVGGTNLSAQQLTYLSNAPSGGGGGTIIPTPPPPSSYATVIVQKTELWDSDILLGLDGGEFLPEGAPALALEWLTDAAEELAGPLVPQIPGTGDDFAPTAYEIYDAATSFDAASPSGASVFVATGEHTVGIHMNGETADSVPEVGEALPDLPEEDDEEGPGHDVIAGGNTLINQAYVSFSLTDAPVIAVMGDSLSLSSISQVNVLSDFDMMNGVLNTAGVEDNTLNNIASILENTASPVDPDAETASEDEAITFPSIASVVRIEGDVVNFNYLMQQNFIADDDVVSMELSAEGTFIESGGNFSINTASLLSLSFLYDMIVVGGDIINVSMINQMNVLLDDDFITHPDDGTWSASGNENMLWNQASIESTGTDSYFEMDSEFEELGDSLAEGSNAIPGDILTNEAFAGDGFLSVLYIAGDLINLQIIDQFNIASESDQIFVAGGGDEAGLTTGSNALVNIAAISEFGVDSEIHVNGDTYSDALLHQAGLVVAEESSLVSGGLGGLVTEAVAFLMDDTEQQANENGGGYTGYVSEDELGNDPMGGMVA